MQTTIDISWPQLAIFSLTLLIPIAINAIYRLDMTKEFLIAVIRMSVQLTLVGIYLEYVFEFNNVFLNITWLFLMTIIGASAIVSKANLPRKILLFPVIIGLLVGLLPIIALLCFYVIQPTPWYNAQYLIPIAGMLLGNSLSGNIVALQNLYDAFEQRYHEYEAALSLGASPQYASIPFVKAAMQKALAPILASMTTTGLVTLPGMMTGQILGGASPILAIKYQLIILIAIFVMMNISLTISLQLSIKRTITKEGRLLVKFIQK